MVNNKAAFPALLNESKALREATEPLPGIIIRANASACFAWEEFFDAEISNDHTRRAYKRAVTRFLAWCEAQSLELHTITPGHVGRYMQSLPGEIASKKQSLAGIRKFFDLLVVRHAIILNPALSVRGEKYQVVDGKTPEITKTQARRLIATIDSRTVVGRRDRAIIATLVYTAARVGAVSKLNMKHLKQNGKDWSFRFSEKGGKSREIPVRSDLEEELLSYLDAASSRDAPKDSPLFRTAFRKTDRLTLRRMTAIDICRMVKRRLKKAKLPEHLSPHSFRVSTLTDLLESGTELADVQQFAGHADPRTTRLYDRRSRNVTRNLVERIYDLKLERGEP
jgi:site-specific recombinase XerD